MYECLIEIDQASMKSWKDEYMLNDIYKAMGWKWYSTMNWIYTVSKKSGDLEQAQFITNRLSEKISSYGIRNRTKIVKVIQDWR